MTIEFRLPDLGEDTTGGEVVSVLVKEGDQVEEEQPLVELETDKALLEVPSPAAGKIVKIHVSAGSKIEVGELIATIDDAGGEEKSKGSPKREDGRAAKEEPQPTNKSEKRQESADESEPAPSSTASEKEPGGTEARETSEEEEDSEEGEESSDGGGPARVVDLAEGAPHAPAAPSTRRLARELGVPLSKVRGSGPGGRISKEDIKQYARSSMKPSGGSKSTEGKQAAPSRPEPTTDLPDFSRWGEIERAPLSNVRKRTIESVTRSWSEIPHVTQIDEADITDLEALRRRHGKRAAQRGGKLTATVFVLKAVVSALKEFPEINASLDLASEELILKRYFNIGVAVDTEHGLLVPVIRDVDKKHLLDLSAELMTLSDRARNRKVKLDELKGATFTITNLGGLGGTAFSPIINAPEVGILGLARSQKRLFRDEDGDIVERLMLPLCLSYDHRVIDGATAVRFLRKIATMLEDPGLLLLEP